MTDEELTIEISSILDKINDLYIKYRNETPLEKLKDDQKLWNNIENAHEKLSKALQDFEDSKKRK